MTTDQLELIVTDPQVLHGQVHIKGTRISVSVVLDCMAAGMSEADIVGEYPSVTVEGVRAAAAYGALLARDEMLRWLPLSEGQGRREPPCRGR